MAVDHQIINNENCPSKRTSPEVKSTRFSNSLLSSCLTQACQTTSRKDCHVVCHSISLLLWPTEASIKCITMGKKWCWLAAHRNWTKPINSLHVEHWIQRQDKWQLLLVTLVWHGFEWRSKEHRQRHMMIKAPAEVINAHISQNVDLYVKTLIQAFSPACSCTPWGYSHS